MAVSKSVVLTINNRRTTIQVPIISGISSAMAEARFQQAKRDLISKYHNTKVNVNTVIRDTNRIVQGQVFSEIARGRSASARQVNIEKQVAASKRAADIRTFKVAEVKAKQTLTTVPVGVERTGLFGEKFQTVLTKTPRGVIERRVITTPKISVRQSFETTAGLSRKKETKFQTSILNLQERILNPVFKNTKFELKSRGDRSATLKRIGDSSIIEIGFKGEKGSKKLNITTVFGKKDLSTVEKVSVVLKDIAVLIAIDIALGFVAGASSKVLRKLKPKKIGIKTITKPTGKTTSVTHGYAKELWSKGAEKNKVVVDFTSKNVYYGKGKVGSYTTGKLYQISKNGQRKLLSKFVQDTSGLTKKFGVSSVNIAVSGVKELGKKGVKTGVTVGLTKEKGIIAIKGVKFLQTFTRSNLASANGKKLIARIVEDSLTLVPAQTLKTFGVGGVKTLTKTSAKTLSAKTLKLFSDAIIKEGDKQTVKAISKISKAVATASVIKAKAKPVAKVTRIKPVAKVKVRKAVTTVSRVAGKTRSITLTKVKTRVSSKTVRRVKTVQASVTNTTTANAITTKIVSALSSAQISKLLNKTAGITFTKTGQARFTPFSIVRGRVVIPPFIIKLRTKKPKKKKMKKLVKKKKAKKKPTFRLQKIIKGKPLFKKTKRKKVMKDRKKKRKAKKISIQKI